MAGTGKKFEVGSIVRKSQYAGYANVPACKDLIVTRCWKDSDNRYRFDADLVDEEYQPDYSQFQRLLTHYFYEKEPEMNNLTHWQIHTIKEKDVVTKYIVLNPTPVETWYGTYEEAAVKLERLLKQNPDEKYVLMKLIEIASLAPPPIKRTPF